MAKPKSQPQMRLDSAHHSDRAAGIGPDHWCRRFFTHIYCSFDDAQFAELYQEGGRYPISPRLLACITLLQFMFRVSDREAVENTVMRRDWRWALGRADDWEGFDPSVLCTFRKRLVAHGWERRIFDHVLGRLRELGLLAGRRRVRVDATALVADVARLSRPELIAETLRVSVRALWQGHPELHEHPALVRLYEQYGAECWLGRGSEGEERLSALGRDGYLLLELMAPVAAPGAEVVARRELLARVLAENFVRDEHGAVGVLEEDERPGDRVVTPHEPDARVGRKGGHLWTGDKVHVTETADDGGDNFVVDVLVTDPRVEDSTVTEEVMERTRFVAPAAELVVADGGYASAGNSVAAQGLGLELVSPPRGGNSRGLLPVSEFTIDFGRRRATCPAGQCTERWYAQGRGIRIRFAGAVCAACPRRDECTTSANGRTVHISRDYQQLLRDRLRELGHDYGDFPAHDGLWEMACRTADDALTRMALVPRVLEARGLDDLRRGGGGVQITGFGGRALGEQQGADFRLVAVVQNAGGLVAWVDLVDEAARITAGVDEAVLSGHQRQDVPVLSLIHISEPTRPY